MAVGIVGYGVYVPRNRLTLNEIMNIWHNAPRKSFVKGQRILQRAVCDADEDVITMAIEASNQALKRADLPASRLGAVYLGSCTAPYVSKASAAVLSEAIGATQDVFCADCQFGGKSGTSALQVCLAFVKAGMIDFGLAVGADALSAHVSPGDILEYTGSSGASAFVVGKQDLIAEIEGTASSASDTTDVFRLDGDRYLRSGGPVMERSDVGYTDHMMRSAQLLLRNMNRDPGDYTCVAFHQSEKQVDVGRKLGFDVKQIASTELIDQIGDTGSASALISLADVLDKSKAGDRIMVVSYGIGAGSDAVSLLVTDLIEAKRRRSRLVEQVISDKTDIDYATYLKYEKKLVREFYS